MAAEHGSRARYAEHGMQNTVCRTRHAEHGRQCTASSAQQAMHAPFLGLPRNLVSFGAEEVRASCRGNRLVQTHAVGVRQRSGTCSEIPARYITPWRVSRGQAPTMPRRMRVLENVLRNAR